MSRCSFKAEVKISGINPYVDVPGQAVKALGGGRKAAVLVKVEGGEATPSEAARLARDTARLKAIGRLASGGWFRTTLVPSRAGPTRLYIDTWMREASGAAVGGRVCVTLKLDRGPRQLAMPQRLAEALSKDGKAQAAWEKLAPSRQREILTYLNFLKTADALERNVHKVMANLLGRSDVDP